MAGGDIFRNRGGWVGSRVLVAGIFFAQLTSHLCKKVKLDVARTIPRNIKRDGTIRTFFVTAKAKACVATSTVSLGEAAVSCNSI